MLVKQIRKVHKKFRFLEIFVAIDKVNELNFQEAILLEHCWKNNSDIHSSQKNALFQDDNAWKTFEVFYPES